MEEEKKKSEKKMSCLTKMTLIIFGIVIYILIMLIHLYRPFFNQPLFGKYYEDIDPKAMESPRTTLISQPMIDFAEKVFDKDLDEIEKEDYEKIVYLAVDKDYSSLYFDTNILPWRFDYAFSVDKDGNPIDKKTVFVECEQYPIKIEKNDFQLFTNLVRLDLGTDEFFEWNYAAEPRLHYNPLEKLRYLKDLDDNHNSQSDFFKNTKVLKSLYLENFEIYEDRGEDMSKFSGLESLIVERITYGEKIGDQVSELSKLENLEELRIFKLNNEKDNKLDFLGDLKKLKYFELGIVEDTSVADTVFLNNLANLEELRLRGMQNLDNLDFIKNMPNLKKLSLENCPITDIEGLRNNSSLSTLELRDISSLSDVSALETIANLESLRINNIGVEPETFPSLSALSMLREVDIEAPYIKSLYGMNGIECLYLPDYSIKLTSDSEYTSIISTLKGLRKLRIRIRESDLESMEMIADLKNLKDLGLVYYASEYDPLSLCIYPLFQSENIEFLYLENRLISKMNTLYIDFKKMEDNEVLKELQLERTNIVDRNAKNSQYENLDKNANEFLSHFKSLELLSVKECGITSLDFLEDMPHLEVLDIMGNHLPRSVVSFKNNQLKRIYYGNFGRAASYKKPKIYIRED